MSAREVARFTVGRVGAEHIISDHGRHFQTVRNADGARRLCALLNEADRLSVDASLIADNPEFGREVLAHALARVFGQVARKPDPKGDEP